MLLLLRAATVVVCRDDYYYMEKFCIRADTVYYVQYAVRFYNRLLYIIQIYNNKLCVYAYTVLISRIGDVIIISVCFLYKILRDSKEEVTIQVLKLLRYLNYLYRDCSALIKFTLKKKNHKFLYAILLLDGLRC